ncbi:MAG: methylmalonyl-CoA epimerase [candidate division Zixibacteria bacterium]|nr:methylmalonyl-CoA epimerase [candidate division Zixibacteria bacterium]
MTKTLVSHVGIAVKDLESAIKSYEILTGVQNPAIENVESEKVKVALFSSGSGRIELLAATSEDSPIAKFINKRGEGLHHICIYVDDIESKLSELKKAGIKVIDETYRTGAEGKKIAFVHPRNLNGVLIELEER